MGLVKPRAGPSFHLWSHDWLGLLIWKLSKRYYLESPLIRCSGVSCVNLCYQSGKAERNTRLRTYRETTFQIASGECVSSGLPSRGLHLCSQWRKRQEDFELKTSLCHIGRLCTNIRYFWPATTLYSMVISCWVISALNLCRCKCPLSHPREFGGLFTSPCEMCIFSVKWAGVGPFLLARSSVNGHTILWTICSWRNSLLKQVLVLQPRLASALQSSCCNCPSAGTTDGHQHA